MRYNGPQPPDKDHDYLLQVWASRKELPGLNQGFWFNEMLHDLRKADSLVDQGATFFTGRA